MKILMETKNLGKIKGQNTLLRNTFIEGLSSREN